MTLLENQDAAKRRHEQLEREYRLGIRQRPNTAKVLTFPIKEPEPAFTPTMHQIVKAVCAYYNVTEAHITSQRRSGKVLTARQVAIYLGDTLTVLCTTQIGRIVNRDHSTCMHSVRAITSKRETEKEVDAAILYITEMLRSGPIQEASNVG